MARLVALARRQRVVPWFAGTRILMFLLTTNLVPYFNPGAIDGDVKLYKRWVDGSFAHGSFPNTLPDSLKWQYPPGAAGPIVLPKLFANGLFHGSYFVVFYLMCFAADAVVFRMLLKAAQRDADGTAIARAAAGPWAWTLGIPAIGPMVYGRYDLVVTAFAVGALTVALKSDRATLTARGVLAGIGTVIKVWPAVILFGVPRGPRGRRIFTAAVLAAVVPTIVLTLTVPHALGFLNHQESRGVQVESVFATPFLVGRWFGWDGYIDNNEYGSYEYHGTGVSALASLALVANLAGFAAILFWRWRARRRSGAEGGFSVAMLADVALTATLVSMVTSRVLSPQYLVWALGLAAVCLTRRSSVQRVPAFIVLGATSVTQLIFPLFYHSMRGGQVYSGLILVGRNAALVTAAVMAVVGLYRWAAGAPESADASAPGQHEHPQEISGGQPSSERTAATSS